MVKFLLYQHTSQQEWLSHLHSNGDQEAITASRRKENAATYFRVHLEQLLQSTFNPNFYVFINNEHMYLNPHLFSCESSESEIETINQTMTVYFLFSALNYHLNPHYRSYKYTGCNKKGTTNNDGFWGRSNSICIFFGNASINVFGVVNNVLSIIYRTIC